jgi:hypothetical protein
MIKRQRKDTSLEGLRQRITRLDDASIDELYGLEPVWEPAEGRRVTPEEFVAVRCPYCGERLETRVDLTADDTAYVEDCQVCCRPIEFQIEREEGGALRALQVNRVD